MPVLVIPLLVGIPVLIGGGYFLIKAFHWRPLSECSCRLRRSIPDNQPISHVPSNRHPIRTEHGPALCRRRVRDLFLDCDYSGDVI